ncbi:DNA cytosine methyltransferase [Dactylosporangium sp. CA-139066]|uniref:DNA cytosine methyltransferase n=1 Tax=Dactylosporangium sp. CA-139066 TaxID=3239930 RepID=UPI003D937BAB
MFSLTDLFCGGGGSSEGATQVPGVTVRMAANHWRLAVDTHNANHPEADHDCADLSQVDPRRYPRTDGLWASPSCTNHSVARGKVADPEDVDAERSRATMWDVQRFAEQHRYRLVFVENVVEVRKWAGFRGWRVSMEDTGYCLHEVFLNSAHASIGGDAANQWRDRWYCIGHPKGTACPDTDSITSPQGLCGYCERTTTARQHWKDPKKRAGKYRAQYVYRCRDCGSVMEPYVRPAADIIDWTLPAVRIGDRQALGMKGLADKTLARIRLGLDKLGPAALIPVEGRDGKLPFGLDAPMRTVTTRAETGLAFIAELRGGGSTTRPVGEPLATVTASGNHHGLVVPYRSASLPRSAGEPLPTVTTVDSAGLIPEVAYRVEDCSFRMLQPEEYAAAMAFPGHYLWQGSKRDRVRLAGNAVTPPAARDIVAAGIRSLG